MSERSDRGPADNPTKSSFGGNEPPEPPTSGPPASQAPAQSISHVTSPTSRPPPLDVPHLAPSQSTAGASFSGSGTRPAAFSSILNPVQAEEPAETGRRRKASHLDSPTPSNQSLPPLPSGAYAASTLDSRPSQSPASQYGVPLERPPRRVLTPRSPSLHRTASLGQLSSISATINAQTTPFPGSPRGGRRYIQEPGVSGAPLLPTPSAAIRSTYDIPSSIAPTPPTDAPRRTSRGTSRARGASSSASPSTSYSSYSQAEQTSPATHYEPSMPPTSTGIMPGGITGPPTSMELDRYRISGMTLPAGGGRNGQQMTTFESTSGAFEMSLDTHSASKVADEKRRRNAGASARFRQRRKEKEKEAATSIARLEQQVKLLSDSNTFYRTENQYLANALRHSPGGERHFPRPPSPGMLSASGGGAGQMHTPLSMDSQGYPMSLEHERAGAEEGRNVRRRTSNYSLPPPPPQPPTNPPSHLGMQGGGFGQGPLPPPHPGVLQPGPERQQQPPPPPPPPTAHTRTPLPPPSQMAPGPPPPPQQPPYGPPSVLHAHPQTGPYNPYAPDRRSSGPPNQ